MQIEAYVLRLKAQVEGNFAKGKLVGCDTCIMSGSQHQSCCEGIVEWVSHGLREEYELPPNVEGEGSSPRLVPRGQRRSFHLIPALLEKIMDVDRGAMVDWSTQANTRVFNRAFICAF